MRTIIPAVQVHRVYAFKWRASGPVCELYAADCAALSEVRVSDLEAAGLPVESTLRALWQEAALIAAFEAETRAAGRRVSWPYMLAIDEASGRVEERWMSPDPWAVVAARLRAVA
jgi:hypothetical protein